MIGLNRSGTKWLSNLISAHSNVYAVKHEAHFGILESNVFNDFGRMFPSIDSPELQTAFTTIWSESDFLKITETDLPALMNREKPKTVFDAFRLVMSTAATRHNSRYWLQKCSPVQFATLRNEFADSKRVFIYRKLDEVLVSAFENANECGQSAGRMRQITSYCLQNQVLQNLMKESGSICVAYEELKTNPEKVIEGVLNFLDLKSTNQTFDLGFQPNTSFAGAKVRPKLSFKDKFFKNVLTLVLRIIPRGFPLKIWKFIRRKAVPSILRGTYRVSRNLN